MAKRILVPLDRSDVSEAIVPLVGDLARGSGGAVRLLHVAPLPENVTGKAGRVVAYADQEMERLEREGREYLQAIGGRLGGGPVECVVRFGGDVEEILREAEAYGADLVALSTSGKSGLKRVILGSVAEQVFRRARVPVLLYAGGPA